MSILDAAVSLFHGVYDNQAPFETSLLSQVLTRIQHGTWRREIARLRHTLQTKGEEAYKRDKEKLVAMTPACAMHTRDGAVPLVGRVASVSNIVHFDLDKLAD